MSKDPSSLESHKSILTLVAILLFVWAGFIFAGVVGMFVQGGGSAWYLVLTSLFFGLGPLTFSVYILDNLYWNAITKKRVQGQQDFLHQKFYQLLEKNQGLITVLNLALEAGISGQEAQKFLEEKSKEFNHEIVFTQNGTFAYQFEYLDQDSIKTLIKD